MSITPAATPTLTREVLLELKAHGIQGVGLSLDESTAARHDSIRNVPGAFDRPLQAMDWAGELALPLQINTLVSAETAPDLPAIFQLLTFHARAVESVLPHLAWQTNSARSDIQ